MASAVCFWNGFLHQGKVTLLYMIRKINGLLIADNSAAITSYEITIEGKEDFDVKENGIILELHQVKAFANENDIAGFIEAIIHLNAHLTCNSNVALYLHTVHKIDNWIKSAFLSKVAEKIKKISDKKDKTKADTKLLSDLNCVTEDYFSKVHLYPYNSDNFIDLLQVDKTIENEIKIYFQLTKQPHKENEADKYYSLLQGDISEKINKQHSVCRGPVPINLNEIINTLNDDGVLRRSENYHLYSLKRCFISLIKAKYCDIRCDDYENEYGQCHSCVVTTTSDMICTTSLHQFKGFLYRIKPTLSVINEDSVLAIIEENGVSFLMKLIHKTLECQLNISEDEFYYRFNNLNYLPTVIIDEHDLTPQGKKVLNESIAKNISNNNSIITELFHADKFITKNLNVENIFETIVDGKEISGDEQADDITKNPIALISAERAKEEIEP